MTLLLAVALGLVQGLTEFLPVSSSGHLVLGAHLLGLHEPQVLFDLALHMGTLLATIAFFRSSFLAMAREGTSAVDALRQKRPYREIVKLWPNAHLLVLVVLGSVPTAVIGVAFKDYFESLFAEPRWAAGMLLVTAALLLVTSWVRGRGRDITAMRVSDALLIGLAQGLAIVPGISRSGSTIACGLLLGLDRELAARYSFILSVPAILGAFVLKAAEASSEHLDVSAVLLGFVVAAVSGLFALAVLMPVVRRGRIYLFAFYLVPLALLGLWQLQ